MTFRVGKSTVVIQAYSNENKYIVHKTIHYGDVIMSAMASQITSFTIVYSTVYSGTDQRKHQSSASLAFVRGIHRSPVNSPHKVLVTRKMFPFDDVIMNVGWFMQMTLPKDVHTPAIGGHKGTVMHSLDVSLLLASSSYWTDSRVGGDFTHHDSCDVTVLIILPINVTIYFCEHSLHILFQPNVVRVWICCLYRPSSSYMKTVMKYIDWSSIKRLSLI